MIARSFSLPRQSVTAGVGGRCTATHSGRARATKLQRFSRLAASGDTESTIQQPDGVGSSISVPSSLNGSTAAPTTATTATAHDDAQRQAVLDEAKAFLERELATLFSTGRPTPGKYASNMLFEDPLVRLSDLAGYSLNLTMLRTVFDINFTVHAVRVTGDDELVARWTMRTYFRLAPWRPEVTFTGKSVYRVDPMSGLILSQKDTWDAVDDQRFPSLEAYAYVASLLTTVRVTPRGLETPRYEVLKKTRVYEVRAYQPFVVAQTRMPEGEGPASGSGFNQLAGYIFGGNAPGEKMEMTTPVFTTPAMQAEEGQQQGGTMQFVLEERLGADPSAMPLANDLTVTTARNDGGIVAAATFSGLPFDWEVAAEERALRGALLLDGLRPAAGYELARYNDPFTPPWVRRNEVLIRLEGFQLE